MFASERVRPAACGGWLLVGLIALLSLAILALAGFTFVLTEHLKLTSLQENRARAVSLAQAGVMQAVYEFRQSQGVRLGDYDVDDPSNPTPGPNTDLFTLGGKAADFLLVNFLSPGWSRARECNLNNRDRLQSWPIWNVLQSNVEPGGLPVAVSRMVVSWTPNGGERVVRVDLGAATAWLNCAGAVSGQEITLSSPVVVPPLPLRTNDWNTNRLWFSSVNQEMRSKTAIDVTFIMTDHVASSNPLEASRRLVRYTPNTPALSSASFTVKSTGTVRKGVFPFVAWRRLQAEYRIASSSSLTQPGAITPDPLPAADRPGWRELNRAQP